MVNVVIIKKIKRRVKITYKAEYDDDDDGVDENGDDYDDDDDDVDENGDDYDDDHDDGDGNDGDELACWRLLLSGYLISHFTVHFVFVPFN